MKARIKRFAVVQPIGHRPYKDRADLHYRDNNELSAQLLTYARSKWPAPQALAVDVHAQQIIVDRIPRANYSIHEYRQPALAGAGQ
ncbi:hypothetical protein [Arthrobacter sp. ISL-72]|uniref:hypothetical protein n=1 Tax=Arthrobacter sp. ISL-72 TaxID=2819114 RepID=UPI001BE6003E|nr:hypothetical protein [Arthrobacter sp. ISL-72]MBT2594757.1 hypothetical protein [Arthrobacter sp. ISL-72]